MGITTKNTPPYYETEGAVKVWTGLLSQSGTNAPTATILNNTLGDLILTRVSTGRYRFTGAVGSMPTGKQFLQINNYSLGSKIIIEDNEAGDQNQVDIRTRQYDGTYTDEVLYNTAVEIRIYP